MNNQTTYKELIEYNEFGEDIKETLESQYALFMLNHDYESAYKTLGKLMAYRLIEPTDPRIKKNNSLFVKGGVDADHRFRLDYRKELSFIPEWYFGDIESYRSFKVRTIAHGGKRVEGNYIGDVVFPSTEMTIRVDFCNTTKQVSNNFEAITKTVKEATGKNFKSEKLLTLCKAGVYRTCRIEVTSSCLARYVELGEAIIRAGERQNEAKLFMRTDSIINNWIPIETVMQEIKSTIDKMMGEGTVYKLALPIDKAIEQQKNLISASKP